MPGNVTLHPSEREAQMPLAACQHPRKTCVPQSVGLAWGNDGAIYQEKLDGEFHCHRVAESQSLIVGEKMLSHFWAFDIVEHHGQDCRALPLSERLQMLSALCLRVSVANLVPCHQHGGALLARVLARGGEGIVRKLPHSTYYDTMTACKRLQTWICAVTAINLATGGATIHDATTNEPRGTVPLRDRAFKCRVGSLVKVEGELVSDQGRILKPRPCKDTPTSWLVRY